MNEPVIGRVSEKTLVDQAKQAEREAVLAWLDKQAKDSFATPGLSGSDREMMNAIGDLFFKIRQAIVNGEHRKEG